MEFLRELQKVISENRVSTNETVLFQHSSDESNHEPHSPNVVVFPINKEEVSNIVKIANEFKVPVTPFGVGSSLEGNSVPSEAGIVVDFSMMNNIIEVRESDLLVKVQPGVTRSQLNKELKKYGMFFSVDPGADATIGGMAATNASGTNSVRYGIMRDKVRDLEVVLADGTIMKTGNLAEKSSSGYYLNSLFVGSEGTLGLFTEITVKVNGIPEHVVATRAVFPSIEQAVNSVVSIIHAGIPIARCELLDERSVKQVNQFSKTEYLESPTLFLEFHGNRSGLEEDIEFTTFLLVNDQGCQDIIFVNNSIEAHQLWESRHNLAYAFIHGYPGKKLYLTDVSVPISELSGAILHAQEEMSKTGLDGAILGHVGDGNYHTLVIYDKDNQEEVKRAEEFNEKLVKYALSKNGTCTGEHGVGIGKKRYQKLEHGRAYDTMLLLKKTLDPNCILNPGKIFDRY